MIKNTSFLLFFVSKVIFLFLSQRVERISNEVVQEAPAEVLVLRSGPGQGCPFRGKFYARA